MKRFTALYKAIDATTSTQKKVAALAAYFRAAAPADAAWAAYFLAGGKPRQVVPTAVLRELACDIAGIDAWLFDESYAATGDLAEAISCVLPPPVEESHDGLANWVERRILPLRGIERERQRALVAQAWQQLEADERFILIKLIGGSFRVGVSKLLVQRALAEVSGLEAKVIAQRMMGYTDAKQSPSAERYRSVVSEDANPRSDRGQPYPFFLAHQLDGALETLGPVTDWLVEWKYDGIRAQIVRRDGKSWIWTRGEELVSERYPEVVEQAQRLPDGTVVDGEILAWAAGADHPAPFGVLQRRIGRASTSKKIIAEAPVRFVAYDIVEADGHDIRSLPQLQRRALLQRVGDAAGISVSPAVPGESWADLARLRLQSRARSVEGLMLKHVGARYGTGRTRADGTWWKWKIDPLSVDCVLVYAQAGHGRRANVYTDYTFAVWNRPPRDAREADAVLAAIEAREPPGEFALQLVPFAKAYSGLTDEEFKRVDRVIRRTTVDKYGPVRSVRPSMVFELGFEGVNRSARHKSGIATRFPRMLRIRDDKSLWQADTLATLEALMALPEDDENRDAGRRTADP